MAGCVAQRLADRELGQLSAGPGRPISARGGPRLRKPGVTVTGLGGRPPGRSVPACGRRELAAGLPLNFNSVPVTVTVTLELDSDLTRNYRLAARARLRLAQASSRSRLPY